MFISMKKLKNCQLCLVGIQVFVILSPCTFPYFFKTLGKVKNKNIFCRHYSLSVHTNYCIRSNSQIVVYFVGNRNFFLNLLFMNIQVLPVFCYHE